MQDKRIHETENHSIGADSQRKRQNGRECEALGLAQHAQSEAQIRKQRFEKVASQCSMRFFLVVLVAAKLDACTPLRLGASQARTHKIVGTAADMRAKLLVHVFGDLRTAKELGSNGTKIREEFHIFSGCAPSTEAIAEARRFQPSCSSRSRLRP